jgi:hypothetical protein
VTARAPLVLLALSLAGCAGVSPGSERKAKREPGEACLDLALSFYTVAERRDDGMTREEQVTRAQRRVDRRRGDETFSHWLRIIDLVYRVPRDTPKEIARRVLESCEVDPQGQAVMKAPWPTGVRGRP